MKQESVSPAAEEERPLGRPVGVGEETTVDKPEPEPKQGQDQDQEQDQEQGMRPPAPKMENEPEPQPKPKQEPVPDQKPDFGQLRRKRLENIINRLKFRGE